MSSFWVRLKFVISLLYQASMVTFVEVFQRTCAYPRFISFLQYGNGTSAQFVIV